MMSPSCANPAPAPADATKAPPPPPKPAYSFFAPDTLVHTEVNKLMKNLLYMPGHAAFLKRIDHFDVSDEQMRACNCMSEIFGCKPSAPPVGDEQFSLLPLVFSGFNKHHPPMFVGLSFAGVGDADRKKRVARIVFFIKAIETGGKGSLVDQNTNKRILGRCARVFELNQELACGLLKNLEHAQDVSEEYLHEFYEFTRDTVETPFDDDKWLDEGGSSVKTSNQSFQQLCGLDASGDANGASGPEHVQLALVVYQSDMENDMLESQHRHVQRFVESYAKMDPLLTSLRNALSKRIGGPKHRVFECLAHGAGSTTAAQAAQDKKKKAVPAAAPLAPPPKSTAAVSKGTAAAKPSASKSLDAPAPPKSKSAAPASAAGAPPRAQKPTQAAAKAPQPKKRPAPEAKRQSEPKVKKAKKISMIDSEASESDGDDDASSMSDGSKDSDADSGDSDGSNNGGRHSDDGSEIDDGDDPSDLSEISDEDEEEDGEEDSGEEGSTSDSQESDRAGGVQRRLRKNVSSNAPASPIRANEAVAAPSAAVGGAGAGSQSGQANARLRRSNANQPTDSLVHEVGKLVDDARFEKSNGDLCEELKKRNAELQKCNEDFVKEGKKEQLTQLKEQLTQMSHMLLSIVKILQEDRETCASTDAGISRKVGLVAMHGMITLNSQLDDMHRAYLKAFGAISEAQVAAAQARARSSAFFNNMTEQLKMATTDVAD